MITAGGFDKAAVFTLAHEHKPTYAGAVKAWLVNTFCQEYFQQKSLIMVQADIIVGEILTFQREKCLVML